MNRVSRSLEGSKLPSYLGVVLSLTIALAFVSTAQAQIALNEISTDIFTNTTSQHATQVEPDTFAFGSTIVSAFQSGRFVTGGGSSDIEWATSTNGGATWTTGSLPGTTVFAGGSYDRISDPTVAYDAAHGKWIIATIGIKNSTGVAVLASTSSDGITWNNPVVVNSTSGFDDKDWVACDNSPSSAFFGHCYVEWDEAFSGDQVRMSTSSNGGVSWGAFVNVPGAFGLGGQPLVQPNGTVVVPYLGSAIQAFTSTNGGTSWTSPVTVASVTDHGVAGGMRTSPLPSAEIDAAGKVYVVWQDCRFRAGCSSNDIVMSSSSDGRTWSAVARIPIDATTSTVDHFIPGIAVDPSTSGTSAHLGLSYYFFPVSNCSTSTCALNVGFIKSTNGGSTWTKSARLAGPMKVNWIASTDQGNMVGDYISTSYVNGKGFGVFAKALQKNGTVFNEAMYTPVTGLDTFSGAETFSSAGEQPVPGAASDHGPRKYYDQEGLVPIPPGR